VHFYAHVSYEHVSLYSSIHLIKTS